ncbi:TetR/AcrR family transcriptional regulator [Pedobacter rhodius]|uniref:TetR/AcrR family transcriptional regulator n=1 Tax=Pedobacter rhodius TaxID=3004098 RepID=A0ABT4KTZ8_9SPHI|nr:TetR/AcrR family transcriptional regulator [Pedobacter sp. SJ11]MCZ4222387.1 TetR/AcrR family transcriptional regulator [Pedobacter sp. SJ11]
MKHVNEIDTEAAIKAAAKKVFMKKGLAGARLQEIADEAGIGRTALHYYFRSKEKLFQEVWRDVFKEMLERSVIIENAEVTVVEKMQLFADHYFDKALSEPELDIFMLNEFNNNPEIMNEILQSGSPIMLMINDIKKAVECGELKGEPQQIFITMISICVFSFAGKAMMQNMLKIDDETYIKLMKARKAYVIDFLKTAFKP